MRQGYFFRGFLSWLNSVGIIYFFFCNCESDELKYSYHVHTSKVVHLSCIFFLELNSFSSIHLIIIHASFVVSLDFDRFLQKGRLKHEKIQQNKYLLARPFTANGAEVRTHLLSLSKYLSPEKELSET